MAGIFISCFPIFPPNMSGISVHLRDTIDLLTAKRTLKIVNYNLR